MVMRGTIYDLSGTRQRVGHNEKANAWKGELSQDLRVFWNPSQVEGNKEKAYHWAMVSPML
jgi:hypothetical protein